MRTLLALEMYRQEMTQEDSGQALGRGKQAVNRPVQGKSAVTKERAIAIARIIYGDDKHDNEYVDRLWEVKPTGIGGGLRYWARKDTKGTVKLNLHNRLRSRLLRYLND